MMTAGALIVIETETLPRSMPSKSCRMSSIVSTATPSRPTSPSERVVAVEAHERGQVEGRAQAGLALVEQELEALVGLPRRCRSRRTDASSTAGRGTSRMHAARERILPGIAEIGPSIEALEIFRRVERLDRHAADGGRRLLRGAAAFSFSQRS